MKRAHFCILAGLLSLVIFFHAGQIWPVQNQSLVGKYRSTEDAKNVIFLKANGDFEHNTNSRKFIGKWSLNKWDGDVSLISVRDVNLVDSRAESDFGFVTEYIVGSRFGRVQSLYISNKSSDEWKKTGK